MAGAFENGAQSKLASSQLSGEHVDQMQLSESVAMHLREQIISGKLQQGEFLRIDAIAKSLRVSTTPVREGLLLLQSESFVRLVPRRGFVVNSFSKGDLLDLFWAQATLGAELAARAATKISELGVTRLQQVQTDHQAACAANDHALLARLGHEFHRTINLTAGSPRLALMLGGLVKQLPNRFYAGIAGQLKCAIEYHPVIIEALRVRDHEAVRSLMYRHILTAGEQLVSSLEQQGMWSGRSMRESARGARASPKAKAARARH